MSTAYRLTLRPWSRRPPSPGARAILEETTRPPFKAREWKAA